MNYCNTWINDLDKGLTIIPELEQINGLNILITGASGLIGSTIVDLINRYNELNNSKINLFLAGRSEEKIKQRFNRYWGADSIHYCRYDASDREFCLNHKIDYIIHGASNAYPALVMNEPVETILNNIIGTSALLEFAKKNEVFRFLFISSSEVYGKKDNNHPYKENEYGYLDLLEVRNSYPSSKRAVENLCIAYADEYSLDTVIVRPGHIYGPTASVGDNRVSSDWPIKVANGKDIIMKSNGEQIRSYCYCVDCATAILKVLLNGKKGEAYNISNKNSIISIKEMANILTHYGNVKLVIEAPNISEAKGFNPMNNSSLDSKKLEDLNWEGLFDSVSGFEHTISIIKDE